MKKNYQVSYTHYIGTFTSFAWLDTCLNLFATTLLIAILNPGLKIGLFDAWHITLFFFTVILGLPFAGQYLLSRFTFRHRYLVWTHVKLSQVVHGALDSLKDFPFLVNVSGLGLAVLVLNIIGYKILFHSFTIEVDLPTIAVFCSLLKISNFIAITPGNIGIQEIAYGFLSEQMGVGMAEGIVVSIAGRLFLSMITLVWGVSLGGVDILRKKDAYTEGKTDERIE